MVKLKPLKWKITNVFGLDSHDVGLGSHHACTEVLFTTVRGQRACMPACLPFDLIKTTKMWYGHAAPVAMTLGII